MTGPASGLSSHRLHGGPREPGARDGERRRERGRGVSGSRRGARHEVRGVLEDADRGVAAALRDEVSNLDAEIDVLRGALKAAGDRVTAASLEERAREAARAILAASSRR